MQIKALFSSLLVLSLALVPLTLCHAKPQEPILSADVVLKNKNTGKDIEEHDHAFLDAAASALVQEVILHAMSLIGVNYRWGGNTPETGLDCSGFIRYVFDHSADINLPRTSRDISQIGQKVEKDELKPGDLVFFNTLRRQFSHVGIYLGDNRFIHAPSKGKHISVAKLDQQYWNKRYNGARRVNQETKHLRHSLPIITTKAIDQTRRSRVAKNKNFVSKKNSSVKASVKKRRPLK